jgi:hypothetical protein
VNSRATTPTAVASRRLLEALSEQTDNRALEDLVDGCKNSASIASTLGRPDLARLWIALADLSLAVAEDHMDPTEGKS